MKRNFLNLHVKDFSEDFTYFDTTVALLNFILFLK